MTRPLIKLLGGAAAAGALLLHSVSANAVLIDNGGFTSDTVSGLDWLDVTTSVNQSYDYVSSQFGAGGVYEGYRYATGAEFNALISNAGTTNVTGTGRTTLTEAGGASAADTLNQLLGSTLDSYYINDFFYMTTYDDFHGYAEGEYLDYVAGILADGSDGKHWVGIIEDNDMDPSNVDFSDSRYQNVTSDFASGDYGSYLVRDSLAPVQAVSEPATLSLLGLGLLGLGFVRRKQNA